MNDQFKNLLKKLSAVGLEVNFALDSGVSVAGVNLGRAKHALAPRSAEALAHCLRLKPRSALDVGSGGGEHAAAFANMGTRVTCIDFGTSVYAQRMTPKEGVEVVHADFSTWTPAQQFDLVWASHILEHQRNVGLFIEKLIACCAPGGQIAITVPFPHRHLWGGHVSLWTPGLLAYNVVLCGVDLSSATLIYGYRETSLIFSPRMVKLPALTCDKGDLDRLKSLLPNRFGENSDAWF